MEPKNPKDPKDLSKASKTGLFYTFPCSDHMYSLESLRNWPHPTVCPCGKHLKCADSICTKIISPGETECNWHSCKGPVIEPSLTSYMLCQCGEFVSGQKCPKCGASSCCFSRGCFNMALSQPPCTKGLCPEHKICYRCKQDTVEIREFMEPVIDYNTYRPTGQTEPRFHEYCTHGCGKYP